MSKGIEVSPKHGVNPTIPVCFFCGEDKNEIALLGRVRERDPHTGRAVRNSDVEVPMRMVLDYEPCDKCKAHMAQGVTLIGVLTHSPDGRPPLTAQGGTQVYPSGAWCVITAEAAQKTFNIDQTFKPGDKLFVEDAVLTQMTAGAES